MKAPNAKPAPNPLLDAANALANDHKSDVLLLNGPIHDGISYKLDSAITSLANRRENVFLILVTNGGDPDAAYVIARNLRRKYKSVTLCIAGECYSAGTIIVLGACEIIMTDGGKLGPLDVQILKKDELGERLSGLTLNIAMNELREQVFTTFETFLWKLKARFRNQISLRMAMDVAAKMATEVYAEVYKQIDPLKVGEDARAMHIAEHYGDLLSDEAGNVREGAIQRLLSEYPSHSCVIDREEAKQLFTRIREASKKEWDLLAELGILATKAIDDPSKELALVLSMEVSPTISNTNTQKSNGKPNSQLVGTRSGAKPSKKDRVGGSAPKESTSATPERNGAAGRGR